MPIGGLDEMAIFARVVEERSFSTAAAEAIARLTTSPCGRLLVTASMSFGWDGTVCAVYSPAPQPSANVKAFINLLVQRFRCPRYWNRDCPL